MSGETHDKQAAHAWLVKRLDDQTGDVIRLTRGLDEAALAKRTIPEKWSLKELVGHLRRTQQVFDERLEAMLTRDNPALASWGPENDPAFARLLESPARDVIAGYEAARRALLARLSGLSPRDWHRPGQHPDYPRYDVHFMIEYLAHHEAHHIYQIYQRRAPLGKIPH